MSTTTQAPQGFTLMYASPRARVTHLVRDSARTSYGEGEALCGADLEYGTGTWDERERAQAMPLCARCRALGPAR